MTRKRAHIHEHEGIGDENAYFESGNDNLFDAGMEMLDGRANQQMYVTLISGQTQAELHALDLQPGVRCMLPRVAAICDDDDGGDSLIELMEAWPSDGRQMQLLNTYCTVLYRQIPFDDDPGQSE